MEGVAAIWTWRLCVGVDSKVVYYHDITISDVEMRTNYWDQESRPLTRYRYLRNYVGMLADQMIAAGKEPERWEWSCSLIAVS